MLRLSIDPLNINENENECSCYLIPAFSLAVTTRFYFTVLSLLSLRSIARLLSFARISQTKSFFFYFHFCTLRKYKALCLISLLFSIIYVCTLVFCWFVLFLNSKKRVSSSFRQKHSRQFRCVLFIGVI